MRAVGLLTLSCPVYTPGIRFNARVPDDAAPKKKKVVERSIQTNPHSAPPHHLRVLRRVLRRGVWIPATSVRDLCSLVIRIQTRVEM